MARAAKESGPSGLAVAGLALKATFWLVVILLPLSGAWIGSSLAAYQNGPLWVPIVAALLAFPLLPLGWDAFGQWRRARGDRRADQKARRIADKTGQSFDLKSERILTFGDRLIVRTMLVNVVFLAVLFVWFPRNVFTALSARGDWFLDGSSASWAPRGRELLFSAADRIEWLWELTHKNRFADDSPTPTPTPDPVADESETEPTPQAEEPATEAGESGDSAPKPEKRKKRWPFATKLHPAVEQLPAAEETSIESVGRYLAKQEKDPYLLVKALHDYAADRVAYDVPNYRAGTIPSQNAKAIFNARIGVCAGYARLLEALGQAAGAEIVYVGGHSRDAGGNVDGQGHAWNAARIKGKWYLLDATWDAGYVNGDTFTKRYTSDYLLTPAKVFGLNHFPDESKWQLRRDPISRGEFIRQPNIRPMFYAKGLEPIYPARSQVTVSGPLEVRLKNTLRKPLLVTWEPKGIMGAEQQHCTVALGAVTRATCALPGSGTYHVNVSVGEAGQNLYYQAAQFEVNRR